MPVPLVAGDVAQTQQREGLANPVAQSAVPRQALLVQLPGLIEIATFAGDQAEPELGIANGRLVGGVAGHGQALAAEGRRFFVQTLAARHDRPVG